jgi:hypothetical protein
MRRLFATLLRGLDRTAPRTWADARNAAVALHLLAGTLVLIWQAVQ